MLWSLIVEILSILDLYITCALLFTGLPCLMQGIEFHFLMLRKTHIKLMHLEMLYGYEIYVMKIFIIQYIYIFFL